jgi:pimeloyl-ACP methyl ester carboxylesterase
MSTIEVGDGVQLGVEDEGAGAPVVLLHGWPVTTRHWRHTVPALVAGSFRVIAVELRGLGTTSRGPGPYDKETLADEVARVLGRLEIGAFAVVGHDWGGTVGYLLAADHRDRLRALVIEEELLPGTSAEIPEPGRSHYPAWHGTFNRAPGVAEALVPGREDEYHGAFLRQSAGPKPLEDEVLAGYLAAYRSPASLRATLGYYRTPEADAAAVRARATTPLDAPVMTIGGEFGMGYAVAASLGQAASHVEHVQVAGAGHYPAEQRPAAVNPPLVAFLARAFDP